MTELQEIILSIYKEVKNICDRNGLNYFAIGGTCIGAVRHNGFIPWDDDMDIAMPREDYEKFIIIARQELPDYLEVYDAREHNHVDYLFTKIHDKRTSFISAETINYPESYTGVFVDIMPIDGAPLDINQHQKFKHRLLSILKRNYTRKITIYKLNTQGSFRSIYYKLFPAVYFSKKHTKYVTRNKFGVGKYILFPWVWDENLMISNYTNFSTYQEMPFEDTTMKVPIGYDNFLGKVFGDYMTFPPKEERIASHEEGGFISLNKPYSETKVN